MNEDNHSAKESLIARHLSGEATAVEENALKEWIALSDKNEQLYQKIKKTYELTGKHYDPTSFSKLDINLAEEWNRFEKSVEKGKSISFIPEKSNVNTWLRIAAVILLVVVSGIVINYFASRSQEQVYQTAENTELVTLPDGSTVSLNRNSRLSFNESFGEDHREVFLEGEGFFDVVPNTKSPFVIKMEEAEVTVLGTSFNVQAYKLNDELTITVETGVVKLTPKVISNEVELRAGEKGVFNKVQKALVSNRNDDINFLAWKTRKIVFEGSTLAEVAEVLRSAYGAKITINANVSAACQVTVTFDSQSLEAVLNVLKSTLDLTYKVNGNQIEITKAGC